MKTATVYCSACDQDVRVLLTDQPLHDAQAPIHDAEVVCLEIGAHCTGNLCPVGATSPAVMAARLVRNGIETKMLPIVRARCESCERETAFAVVDSRYATCTECGSTVARDSLSS